MPTEESRKVLYRLREELDAAGREPEVLALDELMNGAGDAVFLKLRKRWYTPAEVAERVGVLARAHALGFVLVGDIDGDVNARMREAGARARADSAAYGLVRLTLRRR